MPLAEVGMRVMVDMAGFNHGGVMMGNGVSVGGTIVAIGLGGITVQLDAIIAGVNTVTVDASRARVAQ